jgi:hypothetical protein
VSGFFWSSVGQAFVYLANAGNDFHASIMIVSNIDPNQITKVQLYNLQDEELIGEKFSKLPEKQGYQVYDKRITYEVGQQIHSERVAVHIYTKEIGNSRPALAGVIVNNRTTFISYLRADQEIATPTGTAKNDGFASAVGWTDNVDYWFTLVVNHDLDQKVTEIDLHAPAASNTNNDAIISFTLLNQAAKVFNLKVNSTVYYWLSNHLGYVNIHTTKNTAGALRGQLIPLTSRRIAVPTFPNGATFTIGGVTTTELPDGSVINGAVGLNLKLGGAKNLTGNATDPRVAEFLPNFATKSFDNDFRYALPVTIKNKHALRSATVYIKAAAEVADNNKFNIGVLNLAEGGTFTSLFAIPGTGRRNFSTFLINLDGADFPTYLGPGGLFVVIQGTGLSGSPLYVDQLFVAYYVSNAYANNILKAIFYKGSSAEFEN